MRPNLDSLRWATVRSLFEELADLSAPSQSHRLDEIGTTDPELRRLVEELLASDREAEPRLARLDRALRAGGDAGIARALDPLQIVGTTITHFRVTELLASGGMGIVYAAEDTRLQRRVALKFPLPERQFDQETKARFLHEARSAGALDHSNICSIYDIGETEHGHLFIAMPLYDGETLKARLRREPQQSLTDAIAIAQDIARGLSAAHKAGIVHRDLKPANIMLLRAGGVKILDFGLAKVRDLSLTSSRALIGTVGYMAPEQIRSETLDGRTDLWALGVLLFEMLTGQRPFDGDHDVSIAHAILHAEPPAPSKLRGDLPAPIDAVINKLIRKQPRDRYQSAAELLDALQALPLPRPAPRPPTSLAGAPRSRRSRAVAFGLAVTLLLVAAAIAWVFVGRGATSDQPRRVAIWPFEALDKNDVALGLSEDITDRLSEIERLIVSGRLALTGLAHSRASDPRTAQELRVQGVVTGKLREANAQLHLSVQLLDTESRKTVWSKSLSAPRTELLNVRAQVIGEITKALHVKLTDAERARLERPPTSSREAFAFYVRGRSYEARAEERETQDATLEDLRSAQSAYWRALELDPAFTLARARLAQTHSWIAHYRPEDDARHEQTRLEAEATLRMDPDLADAHLALADYWRQRDQKEKALDEYRKALIGYPNNGPLHLNIGSLYRSLGRWEDAISEYKRAMELNPRDAMPARLAAMTYSRLRRYPEGIAAWNRALALRPRDYLGQTIRGHSFIRWQGQADTLAAIVKRVPTDWDEDGIRTHAAVTAARVLRRPKEALAALDAARSEASQDALMYRPKALVRGQIYLDMGDTLQARQQFTAAKGMLEDSVRARPKDPRMRIALGLAYAGLARRADAEREARIAMQLMPVSRNSFDATAIMGGAAEIYTYAGNPDAAFELLDLLFAMPAGREVSVGMLKVDPTWDPLRKDPRFDRLLQRYSVK